jgi:glyoxylase-like metal-dependent hydrolase (beta-lactamase superfamily II)
MSQQIQQFFDDRTYTLTYVVYDDETKDAVVIDPVLDYEPAASKIWTESAKVVVDFIRDNDLKLHYILETHAHADHLSGAQIFKKAFPDAQLAMGRRITEVQSIFKDVFDLPADFPTDGRQFDRLFERGEKVQAGSLEFDVYFTPGHTPADASYRFGNHVFTGDTLFQPDIGTGRCDFPGGSATDLYRSVTETLYALGDDVEIHPGHDYPPAGRQVEWSASVARHKAENKALPADRSEKEFVEWRENRDSGLSAPKLLFQSVQVNVDAGALPDPAPNERRYLKIPINAFRPNSDGELELDEV